MKLQIIIGSTRPERQSDKLAQWVANHAANIDGAQVEVVDLRDYEMPMLDEPISPQYNPNRTPNPVAKKWLDKLAAADAYVLVTPEYNRSTSAVLKNALDYIDFQIEKKPVAIVAHGSSGGGQAVGHLRGIIPGLQAITVPKAVYFTHRVGDVIDKQGNLQEDIKSNPYGPESALAAVLTDLDWYSHALRTARIAK